MNATPATKAYEIQNELTPYLYTNKDLSEFECAKFERAANSIPNYVERNDTLGLLFAIQKKDALMEKHFDNILSNGLNLQSLFNYSLLLGYRSLFKKQKELMYRYKDDLNASDLLMQLLNVACKYLDYDMVTFIYNKAEKIKCDDSDIRKLSLMFKGRISEIRKMTNCSDTQIDLLADICSNILRKYNQVNKFFNLETIAGGHYVFGLDTNDFDKLVDMNFELADEVSKNSELESCNLIAVFRPYTEIES